MNWHDNNGMNLGVLAVALSGVWRQVPAVPRREFYGSLGWNLPLAGTRVTVSSQKIVENFPILQHEAWLALLPE